jgi:hypothetical protein
MNYNELNCEGIYFLLASTTVLKYLAIDFPFDGTDGISFVERFVEGLDVNRTIKELHIPIDFLQDEAIALPFVTYMQTKNGVGASRIRTLGVSGQVGMGEEDNVHHWRAVAELLKGPFGSGLETVMLCELDSYGAHELWASLEASEQSRNLRCIEVDLEFSAMLRHLPNMLYLRKLQFHWQQGDETDLWTFMWAIRKNGSLHHVERKERRMSFSPDIWVGQPSRLLQAWGQRNLELPNVMRPCDEDDDDVGARKVARECKADKCPSRSRRATNVALLPSLLLVARQTPRMAPNHKFSGLLAFSEYIGPNSQNS